MKVCVCLVKSNGSLPPGVDEVRNVKIEIFIHKTSASGSKQTKIISN